LEQVTVEARQTHLALSPDSVVLSKNGIEFLSATPFAPWTEMTMGLKPARGDGRINCTGVVISCTGSKHTGYRVSMLFTGMSRQALQRLNTLGYAHA
jgi:hypothetical protein